MAANRVFEWCSNTAAALKRSINSKNSMAGAGKQAGRWMWGRKK